MNTQTPKHFVGIVIYTLATLSLMFMATMSLCVFWKITPDSVLLASYCTLGGGCIGSFTSMLMNTRADPKGTTTTETTAQVREVQTP